MVGPTGAGASLLRSTEAHAQCFTKQDVLLFLCVGFQNCPMICLYSLQISGLKVYSRCDTVHLWMFVWKVALISCHKDTGTGCQCSAEGIWSCLLWLCPVLWALSWAGAGSKARGGFSAQMLSGGFSLGWQIGSLAGGREGMLSCCSAAELPSAAELRLSFCCVQG